MPYVVAFPRTFELLCDQGQQGGVLKLMKNDHFYCFFPRFLSKEWLILELHEMIMMIEWNDSCVFNGF